MQEYCQKNKDYRTSRQALLKQIKASCTIAESLGLPLPSRSLQLEKECTSSQSGLNRIKITLPSLQPNVPTGNVKQKKKKRTKKSGDASVPEKRQKTDVAIPNQPITAPPIIKEAAQDSSRSNERRTSSVSGVIVSSSIDQHVVAKNQNKSLHFVGSPIESSTTTKNSMNADKMAPDTLTRDKNAKGASSFGGVVLSSHNQSNEYFDIPGLNLASGENQSESQFSTPFPFTAPSSISTSLNNSTKTSAANLLQETEISNISVFNMSTNSALSAMSVGSMVNSSLEKSQNSIKTTPTRAPEAQTMSKAAGQHITTQSSEKEVGTLIPTAKNISEVHEPPVPLKVQEVNSSPRDTRGDNIFEQFSMEEVSEIPKAASEPKPLLRRPKPTTSSPSNASASECSSSDSKKLRPFVNISVLKMSPAPSLSVDGPSVTRGSAMPINAILARRTTKSRPMRSSAKNFDSLPVTIDLVSVEEGVKEPLPSVKRSTRSQKKQTAGMMRFFSSFKCNYVVICKKVNLKS